jgi:adenylate kinase family enzyme
MISTKQLYENVIISSKNIEYNIDKWINSKDGKLLITGYTGAGKSTLSEKLSKQYNIKIISLDDYIKIDKDHIDKLKKEKVVGKIEKYYQQLVDSNISKLLNRKEKLIIEGIQIYLYSDISKLKEQSIIIVGTSTLKSAVRAYFRNKTEEWSKGWSTLDIITDIYHNLFITKVESFIKLVKSWNN